MAAVALLNEYLAVNASNLSSFVKSAVLTVDSSQIDISAMGDGWQEVTGGMKSGTLAVTALDDFAVSQIDAILWPLFGTVVTFEVRPDGGAVSTSNPKYTGSILIAQLTVGGSYNEAAQKSVTWPTSGTVSRATS